MSMRAAASFTPLHVATYIEAGIPQHTKSNHVRLV